MRGLPSKPAAGSTPSVAGAMAGGPRGGLTVQARDLRRTYPGTRRAGPTIALSGVYLEIPAGQFCVLLGPNGSGKSTLLRILATLDRPDAGTLALRPSIDDSAVPASISVRTLRAMIGVAFQSPALDELLSVRENLIGAAALYGLRGWAARARIEQLCQALRIADRLHSRVSTLSGGLRRRVDLARAMLHAPALLLLDEPTAGLDHRARSEFVDLLISTRAGTLNASDTWAPTIIMTTHMMDEAERADRVVLMHEGRIVGDDSPSVLRRNLGGTVVRCTMKLDDDDTVRASSILRGAGLECRTGAGGVVLARTTASGSTMSTGARCSAVESAVIELTRAGLPFEVGPPTLADVYLALTGRGLADEPPSPREGRV